MKMTMEPGNLPFFEALASHTRLLILQLLAVRDLTIKELAEAMDISSSIMTKHIRKLEQAGIVTTRGENRAGKRHKVCSLLQSVTELSTPKSPAQISGARLYYDTVLPVGLYSALLAEPPCGIADERRLIGVLNSPAHLLDPGRAGAQLFWMERGTVDYLLPNHIGEGQRLTGIELIGELATGPGGVAVSLNGTPICRFTAAAGAEGVAAVDEAPAWWPERSRYGIFTVLHIGPGGVYLNGERRAQTSVEALAQRARDWTLRFECEDGLTLFGERCGSFAQDLIFRCYYELTG